MTNKQRQVKLDENKWIMSQECGEDLSGEMLYCEFCGYSVHKKCTAAQEQREKSCLCATAYNRMQKHK